MCLSGQKCDEVYLGPSQLLVTSPEGKQSGEDRIMRCDAARNKDLPSSNCLLPLHCTKRYPSLSESLMPGTQFLQPVASD